MALPNKSSRPIKINGISCRWAVSDAPNGKHLLLLQGPESTLKVLVDREIEGMVWLQDAIGHHHCGPITPNWVRQIADMAIDKGWHPNNQKSTTMKITKTGLEPV